MKKIGWLILVLLVVTLTACGNGADEGGEASEGSGDQSKEAKEEEQEEQRTVNIEDAMGEKTIEGTPEKIVVLEWTYAEDLQALGMEPAGVADLDGYSKWVDAGKSLSDSVEDVGTRQEPNLEAISRLDPDLIIGVKFRHEAIADQLEDIAPTVMFAPYSEEAAKDQYQHMLDEFNTVAKITSKEDKAKKVVKNMEKTFRDQQARITEAGKEDSEYVMTQAFTSQNTPTLRLFTPNSIVSKVMKNIGLQNAHQPDKTEVYGYTSTTVETLQNYQDAHFFYIVQEEDNIFTNQLKGNPAWEDLKFVQEDRTYKMPGDTWTFGGPLSAEVLAKQVTDAMLNENQSE
ncbi:iron complex transport system substrate-binding protein [Halobacillus alkaliphilus]|uniref:Iron complex transport system substrate-binding protein n=1 Tax=Halobacillus alkaliphilus TaxID=396056 RepID=A0A1I2TSX0_9BACI|nr:iron-siderophore ABC transporter substrate-binding protein [Halobacillus alkaliphilus]SFG67960.1 iron complex transport system substrate-binding protein [Halobacillus alkaliphilus]